MVDAFAPSGAQHQITHGEQRVVVVEVGGGIREYVAADRPVLEPYRVDQMADGAHGAPLIPWPNRLRDGRYTFDGAEHQVPLNEPERGNAIHGLLRWRSWSVVARSPHHVVMGIRLHPEPAYPFALDVAIEYRLDADGLTVTTTASNVGINACPYGVGQHPYLSPGDALIDDCTLQLAADTRITTDDRGLPTGREDVGGTPFDFRAGATLSSRAVDSAFTDLARDDDGRAWARLSAPDGRCVEGWVDHRHPYIEIFTGDTLPPHRRRRGLGFEPMTCPPDAFTSGIDVIRLEAGESVTTTWGARLRDL